MQLKSFEMLKKDLSFKKIILLVLLSIIVVGVCLSNDTMATDNRWLW